MITAIYPGTFDPVHNGHIDICSRAARLFDHVIFAIYARSVKNVLFPIGDRVRLAQTALAHLPNVEVATYETLTVQYVQQRGACVMVRGLRLVSDFEYELQMALANKSLAADVETVCLMSSLDNVAISGTIVREVASLNGDVSGMVPPHVVVALRERFRK